MSFEETAPVRVALVDDQALMRGGFSLMLGAEPDIEVVGEAADGAQAVEAATALWRSDFKQAAVLHAAQPLQGAAAIAPVFEWENPPDDLDDRGRRAQPDPEVVHRHLQST